MRFSLALLVVSTLPLSAAPVPKELKKADEGIVGTWVLTGSCNGGGKINGPDGSSWKFDADGKAAIIQRGANAPPKGDVKYAIDPRSDPKKFDWIAPWGEWYGVYKVEDDALTIYISGGKGKEGRNLKPDIGPGIEMYSFKRSPENK